MLAFLVACFAQGAGAPPESAAPDYAKDVAPILLRHCTVCHDDKNLDDAETSGGLSLSTADRVLDPRRKLVVAGKPESSLLIARLVHADLEKRMPKDAEALPREQIETIRKWILAGAPRGAVELAPYHRRETGRPALRRDLVISLEASAPPAAFGAKSGGPLSLVAPLAPLAPVTAVAFSPDGKFLAAGAHRQVAVWNLRAGALETLRADPIGAVHALAFSPDGSKLWFAGGEPGLRGQLHAYRTSDWSEAFDAAPSTDVLFD
ncbi:MAG TPA: c-type cytochrome domain-containing protein, partial [Planctomycetia bacterium]|nr:c-type cytochrome domain-containing protein [Planctomycetia bacterium]